jgi:hypothetical protein
MRLKELRDRYLTAGEDALFHWRRLLGTPDPVLLHPALSRAPRRASVLRCAGKPDRGALVPLLIRAHMEHYIMERRGEQHLPQVVPGRKVRLALVGRGRKARAG